MDTIKCQRVVFELRAGDTVFDNGKCLQLTSRQIVRGFHSSCPLVSKKAFIEYKKLPNVTAFKSLHEGCTEWIYKCDKLN